MKKILAVCSVVAALGVGGFAVLEQFPPSRQRIWSVGAYTGPSLTELKPVGKAPAFSAKQVSGFPARFVADPFLFREKDRLLMFFEVINERSKQGDIGLATSQDGANWTYAQVVLDEPFHLSFPHVFEWQGSHYMIPEAAGSGQVRLYKADNFPSRWKLEKVLLNSGFVDPALLHFNNTWWLFCSSGSADLRLFYAADLLGTWREHPKSPLIVNDATRARMGGRILQVDGRLYRMGQNCYPEYGVGIRTFEIQTLSQEEYKEQEVVGMPNITPGTARWNKRGMHQFDAVEFNGHWVAIADGWTKKVMFGKF